MIGRRRFLGMTGGAIALGSAGCVGTDDSDSNGSRTDPGNDTTDSSGEQGDETRSNDDDSGKQEPVSALEASDFAVEQFLESPPGSDRTAYFHTDSPLRENPERGRDDNRTIDLIAVQTDHIEFVEVCWRNLSKEMLEDKLEDRDAQYRLFIEEWVHTELKDDFFNHTNAIVEARVDIESTNGDSFASYQWWAAVDTGDGWQLVDTLIDLRDQDQVPNAQVEIWALEEAPSIGDVVSVDDFSTATVTRELLATASDEYSEDREIHIDELEPDVDPDDVDSWDDMPDLPTEKRLVRESTWTSTWSHTPLGDQLTHTVAAEDVLLYLDVAVEA